jgi:translation elongation factor EF-G
MAARKKAKSRIRRKKALARKPAAGKRTARLKKRSAPARKKVATKKAPARRPAAKKKAAVRRAAPKKRVTRAAPARKPATTRPAAAPRPVAPASLANEERIGSVTHYYSHLSVAVARLDSGTLRVGDTIHIAGHTSDFRQPVESLQIEHQSVPEVSAGQEFGLKVIDHAREHDAVYKVKAS